LYVVATPLGNRGDLSPRARRILGTADLVACEDTRTTGTLLRLEGLERPLTPYHEHNERDAAVRLADTLASGKSVALASDAGTPGLSDPGFRVVRECRRRGLPVVPVPGPCAAIAALSASGLPTDAFLFRGFLPPKTAARTRFLEEHRAYPHSIVLYESCHRIAAFLDEIVATLGSARAICVARELTKLHETIESGPAAEVRTRVLARSLKGEFTVILAPEGFTP
jgi:16S rRNA (cytidine1402-2'-O)-methyltransferase